MSKAGAAIFRFIKDLNRQSSGLGIQAQILTHYALNECNLGGGHLPIGFGELTKHRKGCRKKHTLFLFELAKRPAATANPVGEHGAQHSPYRAAQHEPDPTA